jgi:hypothetical protein
LSRDDSATATQALASHSRRRWLIGACSALALAGGGFGQWLRGAPGALNAPASIAAARKWIEALAMTAGARTTQGWSLAQVFEHAAQSIEYSLDGYPQTKPARFQHSAGALAFAVFDRLGAMRHSLSEAIPGAPALVALDIPTAAQSLLAALGRFEGHRGALAPHFAYGALDHAQYTRAHLMHLSDHARWIEPAPV